MFPTDYAISQRTTLPCGGGARLRFIVVAGAQSHSHQSQIAVAGGAELPKYYYDTYDPFLALARCPAAVTKTSSLRRGSVLSVERDPIHTAKEVSTSRPAFLGPVHFLALAAVERGEMANHALRLHPLQAEGERIQADNKSGRSRRRHSTANCQVRTMMQCPTGSKPHPPSLLGRISPRSKTGDRHGDGWFPIGGRSLDPLEVLPQFRQMAKDAGQNLGVAPTYQTSFGGTQAWRRETM